MLLLAKDKDKSVKVVKGRLKNLRKEKVISRGFISKIDQLNEKIKKNDQQIDLLKLTKVNLILQNEKVLERLGRLRSDYQNQ